MTHQNHQTNGASLEDCHTNFFALTELYGIKWRKLVWGEGCASGGRGQEGDASAPLSDPVISSYARCLAGDILCVWRRVAATQPQDAYDLMPPISTPPPLSLRAAKELWIFWYGEEPDLNGLVAPELLASQGEQGSWESGLSYECRSLLFKALHNLIERCLLSRDFVRLGKWFVQPYDGDEDDAGKSSPWHLSFSFAFFLHGESTVCASVDVRQHPPVRALTSKRLARLARQAPLTKQTPPPNNVILAPFGLGGCVTGREWSDSDPNTARLTEAWRQLYPLDQGCGAVEVVCGGMRMRYPSSYVLVVESDELDSPLVENKPLGADDAHDRALRALTHSPIAQAMELCNGDMNEKIEDFVDPTCKVSCTCTKCQCETSVGEAELAEGGEAMEHQGTPTSQHATPPHATPNHATPTATPDPHHHNQNESPRVANTTLNGNLSHGNGGTGNEIPPRPMLIAPEPKPDPLDDEHSLTMLYDYSTVNAWLEHPVKRFKREQSFSEEMSLGSTPAEDLYKGHDHTKMAAGPPRAFSQQHHDAQDDTKEYKNLFTSDGLCPTLKDLDQIFDNSDDASGDETLQVTTPPDSNKSSEDITRCLAVGGGLPTELSKMFPTPPSMEAHAQPSPGFTLAEDTLTGRQNNGSPPPDAIDDWSYVFKPPPLCKYVGSSKYAPLAHLPSQLLPPVALPSHAVYRPRWQTGERRGRSERRATPLATTTPRPRPTPRPPPAQEPRPRPHACPLLLNVLLADTVLNVFRDHNFDSCTLCVCNAGPRVVGNIRGADASLYLPTSADAQDEDPGACSCGFSAVVNRRLSHRAGLFYEDEMEITGKAEDLSSGSSTSEQMCEVAELVTSQCAALPGGPACALSRAANEAARHYSDRTAINLLEYTDGGSAAALALRAACSSTPGPDAPCAVHRWAFVGASGPRSSRDVVRLMRRLRPMLQDAIQKRCCGARMWDGVSGPLTWRQFHRLAGRGNDDLCEPQPVPPLLVGHDKEWLSLSPYALRHWERLSLEPYASAQDVSFLALCHAAPQLIEPLHAFFRELSAVYEACRLGRHRPLSRVAKDGLIRVAPTAEEHASDEWAGPLPPGPTGRSVKGYAQTLRDTLLPQLTQLGHELSDEPSDPEPTPAQCVAPSNLEQWQPHPPALMLYLVEPPGGHKHRAALLQALLRVAKRLQHELREHNPLVKIISVEGVYEAWTLGGRASSQLRALAFSVFTGCRRMLVHTPSGKSLTGFGTAANDALFLNSKDEKNRAPYPLFAPLVIVNRRNEVESVLFVSYCLSQDQRWLLAAASDARGELLDAIAIDVHVPHRTRRRKAAPARRLGLTKLMDFILGVMSQSAQPWRLVVGRIGRIGHGELKGWSWLLSRKNLSRAGTMLRELCGACAGSNAGNVPCLQSACLISTEPEPTLRLMPDRFTPDERFSQASIHSHLHTPRDVTATHILVFPTSATTQSNQMPFEPPANGEDNDMNMFGIDMDMNDEEIGEDNMSDLLSGNIFDIFPVTSPRRHDDSREGSPVRGKAENNQGREAVGTVLQQPLALGYLVSTAPLPHMPRWWWGDSVHLASACPAFLKNALHLHANALTSSDDFMLAQHHSHPLDSQLTTDVLRYVLEGYNALSWLCLDSTTHDRRSCLPLHVQVLMQLYHTAAALA